MTSLPDIYPIREAYRRLQSATARFNARWPLLVHHAVAYRLPVRADNSRADAINVTPLTGQHAMDAAAEAFAQFERLPEQHPGTVFRLPGLLLTQHDISPEIELLNTLKGRVREHMMLAPSTIRSRFAREALPGVNLLQVYREIDIFRMPFDAVSFIWAGHTTASRRITTTDLWERIQQMEKPAGMTNDEHQAMLRRQQDALSQHAEVVIRRVKAPHPRIQFKELGNPSVSGRILPASIPVFALIDQSRRPIIHSLEDYTDHRTRKQRNDAGRHAPVIPSLNVYTTSEESPRSHNHDI